MSNQIGPRVQRAMRLSTIAGVIAVAAINGGCESLALTTFAIGASTGVQHTISGIGYRTFTLPAPKVKAAALEALAGMSIKVESTKATAGGEIIKSATPDRKIEVEIERISANATRLSVVAKHRMVLRDAATANEIIAQTERVLEQMGSVAWR
jgi:hypothetical protein